MCVCVCVLETGRERERERVRARATERSLGFKGQLQGVDHREKDRLEVHFFSKKKPRNPKALRVSCKAQSSMLVKASR